MNETNTNNDTIIGNVKNNVEKQIKYKKGKSFSYPAKLSHFHSKCPFLSTTDLKLNVDVRLNTFRYTIKPTNAVMYSPLNQFLNHVYLEGKENTAAIG